MIFKYKIKLDIEVEFDAPLLGVDTTKGKRLNMLVLIDQLMSLT